MNNKAVIFDLDGTLIDSIEDLAISVNQALEENGFETKDIEEYKLFIGDGAKVLIHRASGLPLEHEMITVLHKRFFEVYKEKIDSKTVVYEGIYELLDNLEKINYKKAILSNKPDHFTQDCVQKFFPNYDFINISGQKKELPKKPDPTAAINIAKQLEENLSDIFFVGDTKVDIQTAKNAGMVAIGVLWGFRDEKELRENGADFIVKDANELYQIITS
jgi:phosphoglycolate phosphatase